MDKKERFSATIKREKVDRPAWWIGLPAIGALDGLYAATGTKAFRTLKTKLDDDIWAAEMPYKNGATDAIYAAFDFAKKGSAPKSEGRTLTSPGFFEDCEDADAVNLFDWPDPARFIRKEECEALKKSFPKGYPVLGVIWSAHFQDACAAFGMEDALIKMKTAPALFQAVIGRITDFYLRANGIFYEYMKGSLDAVLIGNDFGSQTGLMVSPDDLRKYVFSGTRALIDQAKEYGLKVMHHSCGAISEIIPDLIECGADVIHPIQALAEGMSAERLKNLYGDRTSFCGGIDVQKLLVRGTKKEIEADLERLRSIFPTGLIFSPSHEAVLQDIPSENLLLIADYFKKAS